ncbi:MAG TPA: hypothetical protein VN914_08840 [Polyangia bacterium]|nr:hypothetical protein [Polyangia bacterium]
MRGALPGLLILACARPTLPGPASPAAAHPLGPLRLARIEVGVEGATRALAEWSAPARAPECLLIFGETEEWLVGCAELFPHDGFVPTGERAAGQPVHWNPRSFLFAGKQRPYQQVMLGLVAHRLQFEDDGGRAHAMLVMQDWEPLHAHHPGFAREPLEFWIGCFVHESFHAHQGRQPLVAADHERRRTTLEMTPEELEAFHRGNAGFRAAVAAEYQGLRAAALDPDPSAAKARDALAAWLARYRQRTQTFAAALEAALPGKRALERERFLLFLEGTARYVEARFRSSPGERAVARLRGQPGFEGFAGTRGKSPALVPGLGTLGDNYYYTLGMYLCLLLDRADPGWKARLFERDSFLIGLVEQAAR